MRSALFFLVLGAFLASAVPVEARHANDWRAGDVQPLDRILPQIRNARPGTFYDAEGPFADPSGQLHYRIKWLTPGGQVIWLDTDARSGRVLGVENSGHERPDYDRRNYNGPNYESPSYNRPNYNGPNYNGPNYNRPGNGQNDHNHFGDDRGRNGGYDGGQHGGRGGWGDDHRGDRGGAHGRGHW